MIAVGGQVEVFVYGVVAVVVEPVADLREWYTGRRVDAGQVGVA